MAAEVAEGRDIARLADEREWQTHLEYLAYVHQRSRRAVAGADAGHHISTGEAHVAFAEGRLGRRRAGVEHQVDPAALQQVAGQRCQDPTGGALVAHHLIGSPGSHDAPPRPPDGVDVGRSLDQPIREPFDPRARTDLVDPVDGGVVEVADHDRPLVPVGDLLHANHLGPRHRLADAAAGAQALFDNGVQAVGGCRRASWPVGARLVWWGPSDHVPASWHIHVVPETGLALRSAHGRATPGRRRRVVPPFPLRPAPGPDRRR